MRERKCLKLFVSLSINDWTFNNKSTTPQACLDDIQERTSMRKSYPMIPIIDDANSKKAHDGASLNTLPKKWLRHRAEVSQQDDWRLNGVFSI